MIGMFDLAAASGLEALDYLRASFEAQVAAEVRQLQAIAHLAELHRADSEEAVLAGTAALADDAAHRRQRNQRPGADGAAPIAEWLALEVGPLLGISPVAAALLLADVVNLRDRHPLLWDAVQAGRVRFWQAKQITRRSAAAGLSLQAARSVDEQLAPAVERLPWGRVLSLLEGLIVAADPEGAEARAEAGRGERFVRRARTVTDGVATMIARVGLGDAIHFDAMLNRLAEVLAERGDTDPGELRRAKAFGILATPARALAMLQSAVQPPLDLPAEGEPDAGGRGPTGCAGHVCGTITVDPERLLPRSTLVVHVSDQSLLSGSGVARVPDGCPVPVSRLRELLADSRVTVRPVFQPGQLPAVDCYEIPARLRAAVLLRDPYEVFPFGTRRSAGLDLDHTDPYDHGPGAPPGQTRPGNLGPLSRRAHRAKTHGGWQVQQRAPGFFEWTSPYGFRYLVGPHGTIAIERALHEYERWRPGEDEYDDVA